MPKGALAVGIGIGGTLAALFAMQFVFFRVHPRPIEQTVAAAGEAPVAASPATIPVGRDPFASPFGATGKGDKSGGVLVKPPGVVRDGDDVAAATTIVNQSDDRWLPPSEVTFVARDQTGRVIARTTTTVSLGPGRAQTVVAPDLGVEPSAIAAIEAHIDPATMRSKGYRPPDVSVASAAVTEGGKAVEGSLDVSKGAGSQARLACAVFDSLDELASVSTTTVDLSKASGGHLRFWLTAQPDTPGPYHASCSVS